tara:strand:+ start:212 stop:445 length:234 start_codon:yes stop_codon:yes gene_type:complete
MNDIPKNVYTIDISSKFSYSISNQFVFKWIEDLVSNQKDLHNFLGEIVQKLDNNIMNKQTWITSTLPENNESSVENV